MKRWVVPRRDPKQRLTAKQALQHPWLAHGTSLERTRGPPLDTTVVQRLQVAITPSIAPTALCFIAQGVNCSAQ